MYKVDLKEAHFPAQEDEPIRDITIGDILKNTALARPDKRALVEITVEGEKAREWTYNELFKDSMALAKVLAARFKKGEHVAIWAPNVPEWVMLEFATAYAGVVLVTANPSLQIGELRYILEQSKSVALFYIDSFRGNPMGKIAKQAIEDMPQIREAVNLLDLPAYIDASDKVENLPEVSPHDPAQIQYTSGTTGKPKGALLSHSGIANNAVYYTARSGGGEDEVLVNPIPLFHTSSCGSCTLGLFHMGGTMILVAMFDPALVNRLIESEGATIIGGVPTMIVAILESYAQNPTDMSSAKVAISGGSMVSPELVARVHESFGCDFQVLYGQTEHCPLISQHSRNDPPEIISNSVGQAMPHTAISIRRTDNTIADIDEVGEICARSPCIMIGYHDNEKATSEAIDSEGWLHTGDLGTLDAKGYLRITGRLKDMIIRGGENFFPAEIENAMLEHPSVSEVAIVGLPDPKWGEVIAAFIRSEGGTPIDPLTLRQHCRELLSPQKTPTIWFQVDQFPMTGSGKIQKTELKELTEKGAYTPLS